MPDIASLGIKIDSSQATQAASDLDKLTGAGASAEKAVAGVGAAGTKAAVGLGATDKAAKSAASSIDEYVKKLQFTVATNGLSATQTKLYELSLQGASKAQLEAASTAIKLNESYEKGVAIGEKIKTTFLAIGVAAAGAAVAAYAAFGKITEQVAKYQELSDKTGESAENIASLQRAADTSGVSLDSVAAASVRLTAALSKTDDESKLIAKGVKALGLSFEDFKKASPAERFDQLSAGFDKFAEGSEKSAVAVAILGRAGAEMLPTLKDMAEQGGRVVRVTGDQIQAADDYSKQQALLKNQISTTAQIIVADAIPSIQALTKVVKEAIGGTGDLSKSASDLSANGGIQDFANAAARSLAALLDYINTTKKEFNALSDFVTSYAEVSKQLLSGDLAGARKTGSDFRARYGLDENGMGKAGEGAAKTFVQRFDETISRGKADRNRALLNAANYGTQDKPKLDTSGLNMDRTKGGGGGDTARQDARALLQRDLEDYKKDAEARVNTLNNTEKLLEARRSAGLVDERDYYDQKKALLVDNDRVQEEALKKQIARVEQESFSGKNATKDQLDNERKLIDLRAQLDKVRENSATNQQVLDLQATRSINALAAALLSARQAAQDYFDTVNRGYARELAGIGQGDKNRGFQAAITQIEEKYQQQRTALQNQRSQAQALAGGQLTPTAENQFDTQLADINEFQDKALASYKNYYDALQEAQSNWLNGASEALHNYADEAANVAKQMQETFTNAFKGLEDQLTNLFRGKKFDGKALLGSIADDLVRGAVKQSITGPLAKMAGDLLGVPTGGKDRGGSALNPLYVRSVDGALGAAGSATGGGSSGGGLLGTLGSIAGAFGGTGAQVSVANALPGDSLDNLLALTNNFAGRASGGPVSAGGRYRVNENSPEVLEVNGKQFLMMGSQNGRVIPADSMQSGGGGSSPVININVPVSGQVDRSTKLQIANQISLEQRRARRYA